MTRKNKTKPRPRIDGAPPPPPPFRAVYDDLYRAWGPQHWWPGRTRFEIIVGAILTQNTAWTNVEKAIRRLRIERALNPKSLHRADLRTLAEWIRPAGYYNVKAKRLRAFTGMLFGRFDGKLSRLFALDTPTLRDTLLSVNGIGPETADSIILYAAHRPRFVIDTYTRRVLVRHGWIDRRAGYDDIAEQFMRAIPEDTSLYNEFHALIVRLGKEHCRARPHCEACPLKAYLPKGGPHLR